MKDIENGYDAKLVEKFSGLAVDSQKRQHGQSNLSSNSNENLYQVIKAVKAAEITIKQQVHPF